MLRDGDYWMESGPLPSLHEELWWEVWLRDEGPISMTDGRTVTVDEAFRQEAANLKIRVSNQQARFPDYVIILAFTSFNRLSEFPGLLRYLAELRRASVVEREFLQLSPSDQSAFIHAMLERTVFAGANAPAVCILDGGVNRGHPLLEHALPEEHNLAWNDDWNTADRDGHGTLMAGLSLYGPALGELLLAEHPIQLRHCLEAIKILPDVGRNNPPDYGPITVGSVAKIELEAPARPRILCMAVTAPDQNQCLPSLWSATLDQMCSGAVDDERRLMFVSAGNIFDELSHLDYPQTNHNTSVQDPAQAWNVITVGAYTEKATLQDPALKNYQPLASPGRLCPRSTTSCGWTKREWPFKPDIVMEGGNYAYNSEGYVTSADELSLLSTILSNDGALLSDMRDTSAATALAARYAALLQAEYPHYWPETIRALLIHAARWTPAMLEDFPDNKRHDRLRCYGYGVPDLAIARECAKNRATMIIQDSLKPFRRDSERRNEIKSNEMHVHSLPWPVELLRDLEEKLLRMRVTLSYFIEPSPGRKGWNRRHRYQSHGLRFDVKRPEESMTQFRQRLTRDAWDDDSRPDNPVEETRNWTIGTNLRTKGSIHSDVWEGTAAELANSGLIAVYPITGWWRERPHRECYDKSARYALIATLECNEDVDIYGAVQTEIANRANIQVVT